MGKLIILSGAPGSGKSTWAKNYAARHLGTIVVSRDEIRFSLLKETDDYFAKEKLVFNTFCNRIVGELRFERDVIADASHLNWASRRKLLNNIDKFHKRSGEKCYDSVWVIVFKPTLETCFKYNDTRTGRANVPHHVIEIMYNGMTDPKDDNFTYDKIYYMKESDNNENF